MITVEGLITQGAALLAEQGIESAKMEARLLLGAVLKKEPLYFLTNGLDAVAPGARAAFQALVAQRAERKPISKIFGYKEFYGRPFFVSDDVLDPRPDSETLVEAVLQTYSPSDLSLSLLELGVGSGCLILTLLKERPQAQGVAVDVCPKALAMADRNAKALGVKGLTLMASSWCDEVPQGQLFDCIISNPPYISTADIDSLPAEVRLYDPRLALDGGEGGVAPYATIARQAKCRLKPGGRVFFEIGAGQESAIMYIMLNKGYLFENKFVDLGGHARCLSFRAPA